MASIDVDKGIYLKTASAIGERHILPIHMNSTDIVESSPVMVLSYHLNLKPNRGRQVLDKRQTVK